VLFHHGEGDLAGRAGSLRNAGPPRCLLAPPCVGIGFRIKSGDASNGAELRSFLVAQTSPRKFRLPPKFPAPPRHREGHVGRRTGRRKSADKKASCVFSPRRRRSRGPCRISPQRGSATVSSRFSLRRGGARPRRAWPGEGSARNADYRNAIFARGSSGFWLLATS
jgi:hypothetical protein